MFVGPFPFGKVNVYCGVLVASAVEVPPTLPDVSDVLLFCGYPLKASHLNCPSLDSVSIVRESYRIVFRSHDFTQRTSIGSSLDESNPTLQSKVSIR